MKANEIDTSKHYMNNFKADPTLSAWENFKNMIALQEGGLSADPNDSAAANMPPQPHIDGRYYHTNRGWTWQTWRETRKRFGLSIEPAKFYQMTRAESDQLKDKVFYADFQFTNNELINVFCMYVSWGGGWYNGRFNNVYKQITGKNLKHSFKEDTDEYIYNNLIAARLQDFINISQPWMNNYRYRNVWLGAIAIFNREFSQFLKKK